MSHDLYPNLGPDLISIQILGHGLCSCPSLGLGLRPGSSLGFQSQLGLDSGSNFEFGPTIFVRLLGPGLS